MTLNNLKHLFWRTGFGLSPQQQATCISKSREAVVSEILNASETPRLISMDLSEFDILLKGNKKYNKMNPMEDAEKRALRNKSRKKTKQLNYLWVERMINDEFAFREKMTLFWANVFVCRDQAVYYGLSYNNLLRTHALGDFKTLLTAVAQSPSMSKYLNNRQNRKKSPNENFARELLELFTLGIGNYTETDIKEAARAFTGWNFKKDGSFYVNEKHHDTGIKTFLGKTGNFGGEDILKIILEQKQCARFICTKFYQYFVNPTINPTRVEELTTIFYANYDIKETMRYLLLADWFYDSENQGVKIKSPIELLVGIQKVVPVTFNKQKQLLFLQRMMGQVLLDPPNVAGWKQDKNWIDANTLMFRLNLPASLLNNAVITFSEKGAFEDTFEDYYAAEKTKKRFLKVKVNWQSFENNYRNISQAELKDLLLNATLDKDTATFLNTLSYDSQKEYCIQLMSIPEYQLC